MHQKTISTLVSCVGIGVHSGKLVNMKFLPADIDTGITFIRTDLGGQKLLARYPHLASHGYSTILTNEQGATISTVEHLMSALWFFNISNITIEIDGPEVPIMDGSAEYFLFLMESAGIKPQEALLYSCDIQKEIVYTEGDKKIVAKPHKGLVINFYYSGGSHALLPTANFEFNSLVQNFKYEIARARTFSTVEQAEYLRNNNMALGGNLLNALVINNDKVENAEKLRYNNEPIRHKILDCIGDFYLSGYRIHGYFECYNSGHQMNLKIIDAIFNDKDSYKINSLI